VGVGQPTLTEAVVIVRLRNGQVLERRVRGARGYPNRPPTAVQLGDKFQACAERAVSPSAARDALDWLRDLERQPRVSAFSDVLAAVPA
jgi:2-methylcitrate dehydratase PrpD